jgi:glutamine synthetase
MSSDIEKLSALISSRGVRMIDLRFTDLIGAWHHVTVPSGGFSKGLFEAGVSFDASSVGGFKRVEGGDMVLVPDPTTATLDPFYESPTLSLICWIREAGSLEPFARDPREIACRASSHLASSGIATESFWGPEFEFYVFDHVSSVNTNNQASYRLETAEAHWNTGEQEGKHLGDRIRYQNGYHVMPPLDANHNLRSRMVDHIQNAGIPVKYHHHEVGGAGQCEIEIEFLPLLKAADAVMLIKYLLRMSARASGKTVTFMPKPLVDEAGTGMHFHQLLMKGQTPVFHEANGYAGLSTTALHYIGGILTHTPALLALTNPSTNSFRRLVPGFEAPTRMFFGLANRSAAVRIPKQTILPEEKRLEFRCPDGTCNPYLAIAAQLLAGLDGIEKKIDPRERNFGPFDFNVSSLPAEQREKIKNVPASLEEALMALRADHEFLLPGKVFPEDFVDTWIDYKIEHDVRPIQQRTHPYEIELYYDT